MLRVTLEMVPFGDETVKYNIGTMIISNIGGDMACGKYRVNLFTHGREKLTTDEPRQAIVTRHIREKGAWALVARAIKKLRV